MKKGVSILLSVAIVVVMTCSTMGVRLLTAAEGTAADPSNNVNLSTKLDDWTLQKCPELASEQGDSMVIDNHDATSHYILNDVLKKDIVLKFKVKFDEITQENNKIFFEVAFRNQNPTDLLWQRNDFYSLMFCPLMVGEKKYVKAYFREAISGDEFGFVDDLIEIVDGSTPEMNIEVSAITVDGDTTFKLDVNGVERVNTTKEGYDKATGAVVLETLLCKTTISPPAATGTKIDYINLSTKAVDYIKHTEADKMVEQGNSLVLNKPSFFSVYQLKDVSVKDVRLNFNIKFEDIITDHDTFVFEISVRNQEPAKYLYEKAQSYSLKFVVNVEGDKKYIKSFFKTNNGGEDDGGFGFCDHLMEITGDATQATDISVAITSANGNTTFRLLADGEEKVNVVKEGNDKPAGAVVFNTRNCKTTISKAANPKYVLTLNNTIAPGYDYYSSVRAIQGIVNRTEPVLFVLGSNVYFSDTDAKWKEQFESEGYEFIAINSYSQLLHTFKDYFKGIITMNSTVKSHNGWMAPLSEVGAVLAGLTDYVPVPVKELSTARLETGLNQSDTVTLKKSGIADKMVTTRLETLNLTTANAIYQWEFDNLKDYANSSNVMTLTSEGLDYAVQNKMMFFDLQPTKNSADGTLNTALLQHMDANNVTFNVWGWVDQEDVRVAELSGYGGNLKCVGSSNLSFFASIPGKSAAWTQKTGIDLQNVNYQSDKYYVTFIASESDTVKAPVTFQHGAWNDPVRGTVPINWGMSADLSSYFPGLFDYYYGKATANDYFYSGGGLLNGFAEPLKIPEASMQEYTQKSLDLAAKTDQMFVDYYNDWSNQWGKLLGSQANYDKYMQYLKGSGLLGLFGGFTAKTSGLPTGAQAIPSGKKMTVSKWVYDNANFLSVHRPNMYPVRSSNPPEMWEQIVDYILSNTSNATGASVSSHFTVGYYGYVFTGDYAKNQYGSEPTSGQVMAVSPTMLKQAMDYLNTNYPDKFIFTTMDEFSAAAIKALNYVPPVKHTITATAGSNGSISPSGSVEVTKGENAVFTVTPNTDYEVDKVLVDDQEVNLTGGKYIFANVNVDHAISVSFKKIPPSNMKVIKDIDSGVTVEAPDDILPVDVGLSVTSITSGSQFDLANTLLGNSVSKYKLYDIKLDIFGVDYQPSGEVTYKIPLPDDYDASKTAIYGISADGEKVIYKSSIENGFIVFKSSSIGLFAFAQNVANSPQTNVQTSYVRYMLTGIALSLLLTCVILKKKRNRKFNAI